MNRNGSLVQAIMGLGIVFGFLVVIGVSMWFGGGQLTDETLKQTLTEAVFLAIGYWLGSSKGSADKTALMTSKP